jgi:hypothetical protein
MQQPNDAPGRLRFGVFEVDLRASELTKRGLRIRLQEQPFQVLAMLLEKPGELVTREELRKQLWSQTVVDFDHGINKAINKIREALGDSAENPPLPVAATGSSPTSPQSRRALTGNQGPKPKASFRFQILIVSKLTPPLSGNQRP